MALQKPTITVCVDGKDHSWMIVADEFDEKKIKFEHRWCQKCGALTQVVYNRQGESIAVLSGENTPYLMVPRIMSAVAK